MKNSNCVLGTWEQNTLHRGATGKCWGYGCIPVSVSLSVGDRHCTTEWLELTAPLVHPYLQQGCPGPYAGGSWYVQGQRLHNLSRQLHFPIGCLNTLERSPWVRPSPSLPHLIQALINPFLWCFALYQILQEMSAAAGLWAVTEKWHSLHV